MGGARASACAPFVEMCLIFVIFLKKSGSFENNSEKKRAAAKKSGNENKNISDFDGAEKDLYEKWLAKNPNATDKEKEAAKKIVLGFE